MKKTFVENVNSILNPLNYTILKADNKYYIRPTNLMDSIYIDLHATIVKTQQAVFEQVAIIVRTKISV